MSCNRGVQRERGRGRRGLDLGSVLELLGDVSEAVFLYIIGTSGRE
jgi:hypothetical protein